MAESSVPGYYFLASVAPELPYEQLAHPVLPWKLIDFLKIPTNRPGKICASCWEARHFCVEAPVVVIPPAESTLSASEEESITEDSKEGESKSNKNGCHLNIIHNNAIKRGIHNQRRAQSVSNQT